MQMQYEGPVKPLASPEEELHHLREQVLAKERELERLKKDSSREAIIREQLTRHAAAGATEVLAPTYQMQPEEVRELALNLEPESDDETMDELRKIMEARGIHNAFSVLARLKNPHLDDDFHRYLVAYVAAGLPIKGLPEGKPEWKALHMTLYEVSLPETSDGSDEDRNKSFKELVSSMQQFYEGMRAVEDAYAGEPGYFAIELAVPVDRPHLSFYVAVPNGRRDLFEKQTLAIFPNAVLTAEPNDYNTFVQDGETVGSVATFAKQHPLAIKDYQDFDYDPLNSILNAFAKIQGEGEGASLQIIVRPQKDRYVSLYRRMLKALRKGESSKRVFKMSDNLGSEFVREAGDVLKGGKKEGDFSRTDDTAIEAVERKMAAPVVETNIRLVASSRDAGHASQILHELEASFNQYENTKGNRLVFKRQTGVALRNFTREFSFRLFSHKENLPLSLRELTTLYHFPPKGIKSSPHLKQSRFTSAPAPVDLPRDGILLGTNTFRATETEVRLAPNDRLRHLYTIGQTGTGKTVFLKNLAIQDIKNGDGICFIDPHGNDILDILANVPPERYNDVIYFDPAELSRPFGLNLLEYDASRPEQKTFLVNEMLSIFRTLYGDVPESMGPAFEQYFRNATQLIMEDPSTGSTLLDIPRVLANSQYRNLKLSKSKNPVVNQFWTEIAMRAEGDIALQNIVPYITNKFDDFTANDFMRPIVGQQDSSFNFRDVMDNRKILLVNLSKGRLGARNANLLGLIIVSRLFMAALSRADSPGTDFAPFYLYIDEFQNITTETIPGILSEARKYKLSLTIAHQFLKQIQEKTRDAIFGNVGSMVIFRVGEEDAEYFAKQFAPVFNTLDFVNIENQNAYVRLLSGGVPQKPFNLKTTRWVPGNNAQIDDLRELSYLTYGRDRETIEKDIHSRYF